MQIPAHIKDIIQQSHIHINNEVADEYIWGGRIEGNYTVKAGFQRLLSKRGGGDLTKSWSGLWKQQAPEKVKFLLWLAWHDSAPMMQVLQRRKVTQSANCTRCGATEENLLHCIRDCAFSRQMWERLGMGTTTFFQSSDFLRWQQEAVEEVGVSHFYAGLRSSWCACNSVCIGGEDVQIHKLVREANHLTYVLDLALRSHTSQDRRERRVTWHPSREDVLVLNVDGSSMGNPGPAGLELFFEQGMANGWRVAMDRLGSRTTC